MTAAYDSIADWYDQIIRADALAGDLVLPYLFELAGPVAGRQICDLACGQGRIARELARRGANVVGLDLSAELIAIAQRDEAAEPLGIQFIVGDAQRPAGLAAGQFDGVVCNMALMDIPDLEAVFQAVFKLLRSSGWFVFSLTHPCFSSPHAQGRTAADGDLTWEISTYFVEGFWRSDNPEGVRGRVGAYHRTLSTYLNNLVRAGFQIERMIEPQATGATLERVPSYGVVPAFLLVRCSKKQ